MRWMIAALLTLLPVGARAGDQESSRRGEHALLTRSFNPTIWSLTAYRNVWKQWGDGRTDPPALYADSIMERYGLHPAPFPNDGLPMGLRHATGLLGKGLSTDCLICHGGSIAGKSYVGLGNTALDMQALYSELALADRRSGKTPFPFSQVRGTTEAGAMSVFLLGYRDANLSVRLVPRDLGLHSDMCEDPPAWWLLKKKRTMYQTGGGDARSVRSLMQFMMSPFNSGPAIRTEEATFRDIQAYLLSLTPPPYQLPVDRQLADTGARLFSQHCARCHGTYGANWTYPNKIIPIDEIGTDRRRFDGLEERFGRAYNESWFAKERPGWLADDFGGLAQIGYQAPPLDGLWATAPYFHNGSAPTVYHVLNSKARPKIFTRSYRTGLEEYDATKLGWKVQLLDYSFDPKLPEIERRRIYDTRQPGRGNSGHTYGDELTEDERMAVIEYLKTL